MSVDKLPQDTPKRAASDYTFSLAPVTDRTQLERDWKRLEGEIRAPFFLSWDWLGCWLEHADPKRPPHVLRAEQAGELVGIALLTPRRRRWLGLIPRKELHLHETGDSAIDSLTIEYNGILTAPRLRDEVTVRAVAWLLSSGQADALHLSGLPASVLDRISASGLAIHLRDRKPTYGVNLERIRATGGSFVSTLSANMRNQLRRAARQFATLGELRLIEATSADEALHMLQDMVSLHQEYWQGRGHAGAFANPAFLAFHRQLIRDGFAAGCVQLLRCQAGQSVIGYLYNFVKDRWVYSYQSGFDYALLSKSKPGWLCHQFAIEHNLQRGMEVYDLLAGASQFKASFGEARENLVWITVERPGWKPTLIRRLRVTKHWLKAHLNESRTRA